ncbi:MAG: HlyD family type I secretion periplasmic adaptor subunit [Thiomicrospira sp.]|jgi:adhesin transport system membrane fusion protein|nr:HlyD family type I secretion periplasmic adaptor subunit [Thiomicrospira sp.]
MKPHKLGSRRLNNDDLAYMSSLSQAALEKPPMRSRVLVWAILLALVWLLVWANMAQLDKIVRGEGKVVPSSRVQLVQNFEGGIVEQILVAAGDRVQRDQVLIQLDSTQFGSSFDEKRIELQALKAKAARLEAEASGQPFVQPQAFDSEYEATFYAREQSLFLNRQQQVQTTVNILQQQVVQHQTELDNAYQQEVQLGKSHDLLLHEINMMQPLVRQGFASEVDLLKTQREANDTFGKLNAVRQSIPRYQALIEETKQKINETRQKARNESKEALNETQARISQLESVNVALQDKVMRTRIRAPVDGVISELLVTSLGEVVQPGSDVVKIVPVDESLVLETKILPSDIGFIYPGLKARVKFTAYDFAVYGGLDGTVERVSADTITDDQGNSFYLARIKTDKNHLGSAQSPLFLMAGMTASVDIIVGKHTVLDYVLKPIIKAKELALRES